MKHIEFLNRKEANVIRSQENAEIIEITQELLCDGIKLHAFFAQRFGWTDLSKNHWDRITDCFVDEWRLAKRAMYIVYSSEILSSALLKKDLESYFFSLFSALVYHHSTDRRSGCLRKDTHFRVIFEYKDEEDRKEKEQALEQIKKNINWEYYNR